jgi:hypothetical protein
VGLFKAADQRRKEKDPGRLSYSFLPLIFHFRPLTKCLLPLAYFSEPLLFVCVQLYNETHFPDAPEKVKKKGGVLK